MNLIKKKTGKKSVMDGTFCCGFVKGKEFGRGSE
jgi:hypothetical protein